MQVAFYGDSLTEGSPGVSAFGFLERRLPSHHLINYGRGGDTVMSLYQRVLRQASRTDSDIAVVWIGTNDILSKLSASHTVLKHLTHQPPAQSLESYRAVYERLLQLLGDKSRNILAISPLLIGEDPTSNWNRQLSALGDIMADVADGVSNCSWLNLHSRMVADLAGRAISPYLPNRLTRIAIDLLAVRTAEEVDTLAARRGLHFTLDGVHLNSAGAQWVADAMLEALGPWLGSSTDS